ncbi:MAG: amidohydrolase family protein [Candidatus Thorarchaeota archaeon]
MTELIIDGHAHALAEFSTIESILEIMSVAGVDKIILCPGGGGENSSYKPIRPKPLKISLMYNQRIHFLSNRFMRFTSRKIGDRDFGNIFVNKLVQALPDKLIQFYWVNPLDNDYFEKMVEAYKKWHYKGIKLHQCIIPFSNNGPEVKKIAQFAQENTLPVFIHVFSSKEADRLIDLAREFPKTNFIIAHLMGFDNVFRKGKDLSNIYFDISPYYITSNKRILKAVKQFGSDHVILGSDTPFGIDNLKNNIQRVKNIPELTEEQKKMILGRNISHLLNL